MHPVVAVDLRRDTRGRCGGPICRSAVLPGPAMSRATPTTARMRSASARARTNRERSAPLTTSSMARRIVSPRLAADPRAGVVVTVSPVSGR